MSTLEKTIDHSTLRRLMSAGAHVGAQIVGQAGSWGVVINYGRASQTLAAARGEPRTFRKFETLARYLKDMSITECTVHLAEFEPGSKAIQPGTEKRRAVASDRLKAAHAAAAHDQWVKESIAASLADPAPNMAHDAVMRKARALIDKKRKQHAG
ncbi:hypothetical protein [Roseateles saccharophilus]|uniref:Prevent host death protein, Phd antitoxin n=1 Tax=Roseateles saccharophilus TaxID=304 RepID=A0A4R3U853_ROSSA|nr:hypothetical protein [Roseateles saccharophilus]MDG0836173.1 hypothetical protein [Roseateles saccharophilus]TCU81738.1 hypothetical protein EV671_10725 [Roseateles saccharophilus]